MSREIEDRLRAALSAKTDRIGESDLRPPELPVDRARTRRRLRRSLPWLAPVFAAAMIVIVVVAIVGVAGRSRDGHSTSSSVAGVPPASVPSSASSSVPATSVPSASTHADKSLQDAASQSAPVLTLPIGPGAGATKPLAAAVLGSTAYWPAGNTKGFGTSHPTELNTNGDPSGIVRGITWQNWGWSTATGVGQTYLAKPGGGYYPGTVTIQLQATQLGRCGSVLGYAQLYYRTPAQPGGPISGPWQLWAGATNLCEKR